MTIVESVKSAIKSIETLVEIFDSILQNEQVKTRLIEYAHKIGTKIYPKMKTEKNSLQLAIHIMNCVHLMGAIKDLIGPKLMEDIVASSETYIKEAKSSIIKVRSALDEVLTYPQCDEFKALVKEIKLTELAKVDHKDLQYMGPVICSIPMDELSYEYFKSVGAAATVAADIPAGISKLFYCNMIGFGASSLENPTAFTPDKKYAKMKKKLIVLICRPSNYNYFTLDADPLDKEGLNLKNVKSLKTIVTADAKTQLKPSATLWTPAGEEIDLLKMRQNGKPLTYDMVSSLNTFGHEVYIIDENSTRQIQMSAIKFIHLVNGINPAYYIKHDISEHIHPPKEINLNPQHRSMAIIRNSTMNEIHESFRKSKRTVKTFVESPAIVDIINEKFLTAFNEASSSYNSIIISESVITFRSKMIMHVKKFNKELSASLEKAGDISTWDELSPIISKAMEVAINERDNPFNIIDEKRTLFGV